MADKKTDKKQTVDPADDLPRLSEPVAAVVEIVDVRLFSSAVQLGEPEGEVELSVRHRARVRRHDQDSTCVRVFADFVVEEAAASGDAGEPGVAGAGPGAERLHIAASFRLDYRVPDAGVFTDEQLSAFGQVNGVYNAWPFWREYVYSTMARLGLPPMTLPVFRVEH